jgi:hypothetical protein
MADTINNQEPNRKAQVQWGADGAYGSTIIRRPRQNYPDATVAESCTAALTEQLPTKMLCIDVSSANWVPCS